MILFIWPRVPNETKGTINLKQVFLHNNFMGKGQKKILIPKVTYTVGSNHTLSYINSMIPFEIKYH